MNLDLFVLLVPLIYVCVVETWLGREIFDSEIAINDYNNITRLDRNRHGGRIAFYIRSDLHSEIVLKQPCDLEFSLLSIVNLKCYDHWHLLLSQCTLHTHCAAYFHNLLINTSMHLSM